MNKLILTILITLTFISSNAQDLIITNSGDSISCKITKVKAQYIYFAYMEENEIKSTLIPTTEVAKYLKDVDNINVISSNDIPGNDFTKWRLALGFGYGYRIAKISDNFSSELTDYTKKIKSGYIINAEGSVFFDINWGMGLKYSYYNSKNSQDDVYLDFPDGNAGRYDISDDISIHHIGPSLHYRTTSLNNKSSFIFTVSVGYLGYKNLSKINQYFTMTGKTLGSSLGINYDHIFSQNFALGLELSLLTGILSKITVDDGIRQQEIEYEEGQYDNLSRIELTIGLRFIN